MCSVLLRINKYAAGCSTDGRVSDFDLGMEGVFLDNHRYNLQVSLIKFGVSTMLGEVNSIGLMLTAKYNNLDLWDLNKVIATVEDWDAKGPTSHGAIDNSNWGNKAYRTSTANKNILKVSDINRGRNSVVDDYFIQVKATEGVNLAWASGVNFKFGSNNVVCRSSE